MPIDVIRIVLWGLLIFLALSFAFIYLRHRPRATKGIGSLADLKARMGHKPYTLVQFFAPL